MQPAIEAIPVSKAALWTGRVISGLVILFLLFDAITKLLKVEAVMKVAVQMGFSVREIVGIGALLLVCTVLYAIPRTSVLGAVLLTGYLGGATAIQVHTGSPAFETSFPVIFGVLVWTGLYLREPRLHALMPMRNR